MRVSAYPCHGSPPLSSGAAVIVHLLESSGQEPFPPLCVLAEHLDKSLGSFLCSCLQILPIVVVHNFLPVKRAEKHTVCPEERLKCAYRRVAEQMNIVHMVHATLLEYREILPGALQVNTDVLALRIQLDQDCSSLLPNLSQ